MDIEQQQQQQQQQQQLSPSGNQDSEEFSRNSVVMLPPGVIIGLTDAEGEIGNPRHRTGDMTTSSSEGEDDYDDDDDDDDNMGPEQQQQQQMPTDKRHNRSRRSKVQARLVRNSKRDEDILQRSPEVRAHSRQILLATASNQFAPSITQLDQQTETSVYPSLSAANMSKTLKDNGQDNIVKIDGLDSSLTLDTKDIASWSKPSLKPEYDESTPGAHSISAGSVDGKTSILKAGLSLKESKTEEKMETNQGREGDDTTAATASAIAALDLEIGDYVEESRSHPGVVHVAGIGQQQDMSNDEESQVALTVIIPTTSEALLDTEPEMNDGTVAALAVSRDDLEEEVQKRILSQAAVGEVVDLPSKDVIMSIDRERKRTKLALGVVVVAAAIMIILILTVFNKKDDESNGQKAQRLMDFLQNTTMTSFNISDPSGLSLLNTESPQYQAYVWMVEETTLLADPSIDDNTTALLLEQYALATLYYSTGGNSSWKKEGHAFLTNPDTCSWLKDFSHCMDNFVVTLDLAGLNLTGTLPKELEFLEQVDTLNLSSNNIKGVLPPNLPLSNFIIVDLHGNLLEGDLPITPTTNESILEYLDLSTNAFSISLPNALYQLNDLEVLKLNANPISGSISTLIGSLKNLNVFEAGNTSLIGTIPSELGLCSDLTNLYLSGSVNITGSIPDEIWVLPNLKRLDTSYLGVQMALPANLMSQMTTLEELNLSAGRIFGSIPTEIGLLTKLRSLDLSSNPVLGGTVPTEIGQLGALQVLDISRATALAGPIPSEIGKMSSLEILWTFFSAISGQIPSEIGRASSLREFNGQEGRLSSTLPTELGMLTNLQSFDTMFTPGMHGTIPTELGLLTNMKIFRSFGNITGTLPTELAQATSLQFLGFMDGMLTGTIPEEFGLLLELNALVLERHRLTGSLPLTFAALTNISKLTAR